MTKNEPTYCMDNDLPIFLKIHFQNAHARKNFVQ